MAFDRGTLGGLNTYLDYKQLQDAFEAKKQQQAIQTLGLIKSLQPESLSLKDKIELGLKAQEIGIKIGDAAITTNPNPTVGQMPNLDALTKGQITTESGGDPFAVSSAGAQGLMQIMPDTARDPGYGVTPLQGWDGKNPMTAPPEEQIRFGQDYRDAMINKYGDLKTGLAAYNGGPGTVDNFIAGKGNLPAETAAYPDKVLQNAGMAQPNVKPLYQGGKPFTQGLGAGYQWAEDPQGNRVAMKVPGTAPTKDEMELKKQTTAKGKLDNTLLELQDLYDQLAAEGQIRTETQGPLNNTLNYLANSNLLGQKAIAQASGNKSSTIREKIDAAKSRAAALYIDAAGLSSGQTNSLAEQERFLQSLGGYDKNFEANQQILQGLSNTYGAGNVTPRAYPSAQSGAVDYREYFK